MQANNIRFQNSKVILTFMTFCFAACCSPVVVVFQWQRNFWQVGPGERWDRQTTRGECSYSSPDWECSDPHGSSRADEFAVDLSRLFLPSLHTYGETKSIIAMLQRLVAGDGQESHQSSWHWSLSSLRQKCNSKMFQSEGSMGCSHRLVGNAWKCHDYRVILPANHFTVKQNKFLNI